MHVPHKTRFFTAINNQFVLLPERTSLKTTGGGGDGDGRRNGLDLLILKLRAESAKKGCF